MARFPFRLVICFMLFLNIVLCYLDRLNMAVCALPMALEFRWNESVKGIVLGAFFGGYIVMQVPSSTFTFFCSLLLVLWDQKHILTVSAVLFSLCTVLSVVAARWSLALLVVARAGVGLAEGASYALSMGLASKWIPAAERTRLVGFIFSGNNVGSTLSAILAPMLITTVGWPYVFIIYGSAGFIWAFIWNIIGSSAAETSPFISQEELAYIASSRHFRVEVTSGANGLNAVEMKEKIDSDEHGLLSNIAKPKVQIPWKAFFTTPACWAIYVAHFCNNWGLYFYISWLPTYFEQELGLDLTKQRWFAFVPWLLMAASTNAAGACVFECNNEPSTAFLSDYLRAKGMPTKTVRKIIQSAAFIPPAILLVSLSFITDRTVGMVTLLIALAFSSMSGSGFITNPVDVAPQYAGILFAISNTSATLPGIVGVPLTGLLLDVTQSWTITFYLTASLYVIGWAVYLLFAEGTVCIP